MTMDNSTTNDSQNDYLSLAGSVAGFIGSGGLLLASAEVFGGVLVATRGTLFQVAKAEVLNHATPSVLPVLPNLVAMSHDFAAANPDFAAIVGILSMAGMAAGFMLSTGCLVSASKAHERLTARNSAAVRLEA